LSYYYFHTRKDEPLSDDCLFEMQSMAEAQSEAVAYLVEAARDKIVRDPDCKELVCFLKNGEGKPLARVSLVVRIEPL
jgi:hypothetical protein